MNFEDIQSISIIYGKKERMREFINHFSEFWERYGDDIRVLEIKNNKHSYFRDLKKFNMEVQLKLNYSHSHSTTFS